MSVRADPSTIRLRKEILERSRFGGFVYVALLICVVASTNYPSDYPSESMGLGFLFVIMAALRFLSSRREAPADDFSYTIYQTLILVPGVVWSALTAAVVFRYGINGISTLMVFCAGGIAGGSIPSMGGDAKLLRSQLTISLLPPIIALALGPKAYGFAATGLIFYVYLFFQSREISLRARSEVENLLTIENQQQLLEQNNLELQQASRSKSDFLATMSHEIRTPLNGIIGISGLLSEDKTLNEPQMDLVKTLRECGESLLYLVNDTLDLSKIEAGRMEIESHPFLLKDMIYGPVALFETRLKEKNLTCEVHIDPKLPSAAISDPTRLRQILVNYISNAIKFTDEGGLSIHATLTDSDDRGHLITIAVNDTGVGVAKHHQPKLFKAFSQADSSITRRYGGTGLGLAICAKLAEKLGGRVWMESREGYGSSFYFSFQADTYCGEIKNLTETSEDDSIQLPQLYPFRILIVEDNPINQKVLSKMLERLGYQADVAADGQLVFNAVSKGSYSLVFMDMQMPVLSGPESASKIRDLGPSIRQPTIIGLTANTLKEDRELCLASGMNDFISKPLTAQKLKKSIINWGKQTFAGKTNLERPKIPKGPLSQPRRSKTFRRNASLTKERVFDIGQLMKDYHDSFELLVEVAQEFLDHLPEQRRQITDSYNAKNKESLKQALHKLKGSVSIFGPSHLQAELIEVESHIADHDLLPEPEILNALNVQIVDFGESLKYEILEADTKRPA